MPIFYYPVVASQDADSCLQALQTQHQLHPLIALPGGCRLNCPLSLRLQNGDILILFCHDVAHLDDLLELQQEFENFRIVLVTRDPCGTECMERIHKLRPRYVTTMGEMESLAAVLDKMLHRDGEAEVC